MRKPWFIALAVVLAAAVTVGVILVIKLVHRTSDPALLSECVVPAISGAPVTVVVQGPASTGAGAAGQAAAGASSVAATTVATAPTVYLDAVQLQNASTINAVGLSHEVPERGRVVAVATAWQESKLRNVSGGDRDSVGLFQQRPSQGWGTTTQILDPVYSSGKFYDALLAVPGWQAMSLTKAAQQVQYSAYPDAYAQWEPASTTLVRALSGADPLALSCRAGAQPPTASNPRRSALAGTTSTPDLLRSLLAAAQAELGGLRLVSVAGSSAEVATSGAPDARILAAWAVAHGTGFSVTEVSVAAQRWADHAWSAGSTLTAGTVRITIGLPG